MGGRALTSTSSFMVIETSLRRPVPPAVSKDAALKEAPASQSLRSVLPFLRFWRHSLAETPWKALKARAKVDEDENPQSRAISVMDFPGFRASCVAARSTRRRKMKSWIVSPIHPWKSRWKWYGEKQATEARASRSMGSARCCWM